MIIETTLATLKKMSSDSIVGHSAVYWDVYVSSLVRQGSSSTAILNDLIVHLVVYSEEYVGN